MTIKKISCTQFAGIRDFEINLAGGVNVIYGKNESGKSTIVNLLSRTLFQRARIDGRSDKEFTDNFFPGARKGGIRCGDFADGCVLFETEKGTYTLTKEWGKDPRCVLSTPDGIIKDPDDIDSTLRSILGYGEGVYKDILLTTQKSAADTLQSVLDEAKKTDSKQEIAYAVTRAFAESDGIPVDSIGKAIAEKIDEIAGKHWDLERAAPAPKAGRWTNGLGNILKAYYDWTDAQFVLQTINELEAESDRTVAEYSKIDEEVQNAQHKYQDFAKFVNMLTLLKERREKLTRLEADLAKFNEALEQWPALEFQTLKARDLLAEKENREILDKYEYALKINEELKKLIAFQKNLKRPEEKEIKEIRNSQKTCALLENNLCGMNVSAAIKLYGDNSIEIESLLSGKKLDLNPSTPIKEAVKITVPGVMEMQLTPADVDVDFVESQIRNQREIIGNIFKKYGVESVEELEDMQKQFDDIQRKTDALREKLAFASGEGGFEKLKTSAENLPENIRKAQDISAEITTICGETEISRFIVANETIKERYTKEYGDFSALKDKAQKTCGLINETKALLENNENIPEEYIKISDPQQYINALQINLKNKQELREKALAAKSECAGRLKSYKENIEGDPFSNAEKAKEEFIEQKTLLNHWIRIYEAFKERKKTLSASPMRDLAESFTEYLSIISGGKNSSEFPEKDKLKMEIYSGNRIIDYAKMSEGTKETVALAFRLAVLDHLFPEGKGIIVFDDPFTDMDDERANKACMLVKKCAERHQVIFLTCRQKFVELLNEIPVSIG